MLDKSQIEKFLNDVNTWIDRGEDPEILSVVIEGRLDIFGDVFLRLLDKIDPTKIDTDDKFALADAVLFLKEREIADLLNHEQLNIDVLKQDVAAAKRQVETRLPRINFNAVKEHLYTVKAKLEEEHINIATKDSAYLLLKKLQVAGKLERLGIIDCHFSEQSLQQQLEILDSLCDLDAWRELSDTSQFSLTKGFWNQFHKLNKNKSAITELRVMVQKEVSIEENRARCDRKAVFLNSCVAFCEQQLKLVGSPGPELASEGSAPPSPAP